MAIDNMNGKQAFPNVKFAGVRIIMQAHCKFDVANETEVQNVKKAVDDALATLRQYGEVVVTFEKHNVGK